MTVLIRDARVLTLDDGSPAGTARRGASMRRLGVVPRADVLIEGGRISRIGAIGAAVPAGARVIEARGRVLMPGFIDAHTHALWAGDRLDEWEKKRAGVPYLDILKSGGGIMSTVRAVRAASEDELWANLGTRLRFMLREGTTTVEVKSGYGLSAEAELTMLRVIDRCARREGVWPTVIPTALLGHALDPDVPREEFVRGTIEDTLARVHENYPGIAIDAFAEDGAWSVQECIALFQRAAALGHPFRVHADQFTGLGMVEWAVANGARSVDHLEATPRDGLERVAASPAFAVVLPCAGFHTDGRYADARRLIDAGGAVVLATNVNPGSAPCSSMPMAIALAVRHLKLSPAEAIAACTANAAALLGLADRGVIAPGRRADLILLRHGDERQLAYEFGGNPVDVTIVGGAVAHAAE